MSYINLKDSSEYNAYTNNGNNLVAGDIYIVENPSECHFRTNNIDWGDKVYNYGSSEDFIKNWVEGNVETLIIPDGTTKIADGVFYKSNCNNILIPNTVTSIGKSSFAYCTISSIILPNNLITIDEDAFFNCPNLTNIVIPDSVTKLDSWSFGQCSKLVNVTIGNGVTSIGEYAFYKCTDLTSIIIPSNVTSIGNYVFCNSSLLTSVTVEATTPPTLGTTVFSGNASNRKIYVPAESVNAYKAATNWKSYASAIYPIE